MKKKIRVYLDTSVISYLDQQESYQEYVADNETSELANLVIKENILKPKSKDDALHIASAILSGSDIILN